jgi:hypothetical protein
MYGRGGRGCVMSITVFFFGFIAFAQVWWHPGWHKQRRGHCAACGIQAHQHHWHQAADSHTSRCAQAYCCNWALSVVQAYCWALAGCDGVGAQLVGGQHCVHDALWLSTSRTAGLMNAEGRGCKPLELFEGKGTGTARVVLPAAGPTGCSLRYR